MTETKKKIKFFPLMVSLLILSLTGVFLFIKSHPKIEAEKISANTEADFAPSTAAQASSARLKKEYKYAPTIKIIGSPKFKARATQALKIIWMYDEPIFRFIKKYAYEIKESDSTGFSLVNSIPVVSISDKNAYKSITWCAGIIAHQTFHGYAKIIKTKTKKRIPPPPGKKDSFKYAINPLQADYTGLDTLLAIEDRASRFQLKLLKKIGAPKRELNLLIKRRKKDFSISHDGHYSVNP